MKKFIVWFTCLMVIAAFGAAFAEDAEYTCDQNIEDFWNREYDNLTITLDERCTRCGAYYTEYEFQNITAKNIDYTDRQTASKYGVFLRLTDSIVDYLHFSNYTQRGGISLRGTSEVGTIEVLPTIETVSITGNGSDYENRVLLDEPENHSVNKIIWHAVVQGVEKPPAGDGRVLNLSGVTVDSLEIVSDPGNYETRIMNLNDYTYIDKFYSSIPMELKRNLPATATDEKRFEPTIGTLVIAADKLFNINYDGVIANNTIILGNNSNAAGGVAFTDQNFGLLGNVVALGGNLSLTNYRKFPGKPTINTLYVDNCGLNMDDIRDVLSESENLVDDILAANASNVSYNDQVQYYFTVSYANVENVRYSSSIPEPAVTLTNESALIGNKEPF